METMNSQELRKLCQRRKTSSEVELMETISSASARALRISRKTSSEVELMETAEGLALSHDSKKSQDFF